MAPMALKAEAKVLMTSRPSWTWPQLPASLHLHPLLLSNSPSTPAALAFFLFCTTPAVGLCTCCSFFLECSSPRYLMAHPSPLSGLSNVTFSMRPPWSSCVRLPPPHSSVNGAPYTSLLSFHSLIYYVFFFPLTRIWVPWRSGFLFLSTAISQCLKQHRTHSKCSVNTCWGTDWMNFLVVIFARRVGRVTAFPKESVQQTHVLIEVFQWLHLRRLLLSKTSFV